MYRLPNDLRRSIPTVVVCLGLILAPTAVRAELTSFGSQAQMIEMAPAMIEGSYKTALSETAVSQTAPLRQWSLLCNQIIAELNTMGLSADIANCEGRGSLRARSNNKSRIGQIEIHRNAQNGRVYRLAISVHQKNVTIAVHEFNAQHATPVERSFSGRTNSPPQAFELAEAVAEWIYAIRLQQEIS